MNERIKELELEATAYADSKVPTNNRYNDIYYAIVRRKFAELIVRECADIADEHNDYSEGVTLGVGRALKKHFGVEL